jgi:hypothetical protein
VVVVEVTPGGPGGGGGTIVGWMVVVRSVRVTLVSEPPPQAASVSMPVKIAPALRIRKAFVVLFMIALHIVSEETRAWIGTWPRIS